MGYRCTRRHLCITAFAPRAVIIPFLALSKHRGLRQQKTGLTIYMPWIRGCRLVYLTRPQTYGVPSFLCTSALYTRILYFAAMCARIVARECLCERIQPHRHTRMIAFCIQIYHLPYSLAAIWAELCMVQGIYVCRTASTI